VAWRLSGIEENESTVLRMEFIAFMSDEDIFVEQRMGDAPVD
jgi:hypothetical protein